MYACRVYVVTCYPYDLNEKTEKIHSSIQQLVAAELLAKEFVQENTAILVTSVVK